MKVHKRASKEKKKDALACKWDRKQIFSTFQNVLEMANCCNLGVLLVGLTTSLVRRESNLRCENAETMGSIPAGQMFV